MEKYIDIAIDEALKSDHRHKIGCVIFSKKSLLSKGHNTSQKTKKKLHPKYLKWENSIHAEVDAIINARTGLKDACMLVIRINRDKVFRLAKPCKNCMMYINHVGIKKVYYSINGYPYFESIKRRDF